MIHYFYLKQHLFLQEQDDYQLKRQAGVSQKKREVKRETMRLRM